MQYTPPNAPFPPPVPERKHFGFFAALFLSFLSGALYRDVARRWRGMGFWYLVWLLLVTWSPLAIYSQLEFKKFVQTSAPASLQGFPTVTIDNGQVTSDPDPYLWKDPQTGKAMLYIDTTGAFDLSQGKDARMKLSKSKLEVKKNAVETQTIDLSTVNHFYIDQTTLLSWLVKGSHFVAAGIIGWGLTAALVYHLVQILIFAAIGSAIASAMRANLSFGAMMRLTAVAITPAMILSAVVDFAHINACGMNFLYLIIEWVAIVLAIKANSGVAAAPPGGFAVYPPGYGVAPGGYPQQPPMPPPIG